MSCTFFPSTLDVSLRIYISLGFVSLSLVSNALALSTSMLLSLLLWYSYCSLCRVFTQAPLSSLFVKCTLLFYASASTWNTTLWRVPLQRPSSIQQMIVATLLTKGIKARVTVSLKMNAKPVTATKHRAWGRDFGQQARATKLAGTEGWRWHTFLVLTVEVQQSPPS